MLPTTAEIVARKSLQMECGVECVDWAVGLLSANLDTPHLRQLGGIVAPYSHFEIARLRDLALEELGQEPVSRSTALVLFARERMRSALAGYSDLMIEVRGLARLCAEMDYQTDLYPFYELECDYDLPGANLTGVLEQVRKFAAEFVRRHEGDTPTT